MLYSVQCPHIQSESVLLSFKLVKQAAIADAKLAKQAAIANAKTAAHLMKEG